VGLKVGKGDAIVNTSADTFTTSIYDFSFTCVDFNRIIQFVKRMDTTFLKGFTKGLN